ncbi:MAG: hypothetical protein L6R41_003068 [Letrouitia leprolyta]|nr:MAG: hypothetical protein L6R41_003068 [Letrouitia leprolyta]
MGKNLCHTSRNPGRTKTMNFFAVGGEDEQGNPGRLTVLDMPGYGHKSRAEWGQEIMKYLVGRKQLNRAFVLVDTVHGLKRSDEALLQALRENAISHQIVLSKVDRLLFPGTRKPSIQLLNRHKIEVRRRGESIRARLDAMNVQGPKALGEIIACSTEASLEKGKCLGINNLRWSILTATGLNEVRRDSFMYEPSTAQTLAREPPTAAS